MHAISQLRVHLVGAGLQLTFELKLTSAFSRCCTRHCRFDSLRIVTSASRGMKYGTELARRSVPEWRAHNILYNDLKDEIKLVTSKQVPQKAHDKLTACFNDEYNNVSLFVKSKNGEIDYRISRCEKLVDSIAHMDELSTPTSASISSMAASTFPQSPSPRTVPVPALPGSAPDQQQAQQREGLVYQLHREISRLTRDIQQLSRFIGVQHTGFRKLIKKYRKWSCDPQKLLDFERQLEGPDSFTHVDFTPRFLELSTLYDMVRSNKFRSIDALRAELAHGSAATPDSQQLSRADRLLRFDTNLISAVGQTVRMWVHPDNIMELKVQLLKHMNLVSDASEEHQHNLFTFLDTKSYHYAQSRNAPGCLLNVTLFRDDDSDAETSATVLCAPTGGLRNFTVMELSPDLEKTLREGKLRPEQVEGEQNSHSKLALSWYLSREVAPTTKVKTTRVRFNLQEKQRTPETDPKKIWAAIDSDVVVQDASESRFANFPYSILEIKWSDDERPAWLNELTQSHLVHTVSTSFGLDKYALLVKYPSIFVGVPSWMQTLESGEDIRRAAKSTTGGRDSQRNSIKSIHRLNKKMSHGILLNDASRRQDGGSDDSSVNGGSRFRYWNEFDHPDDDDNGDAFAVFIDGENESLQRARTAEKLSRPIVQFSKQVRRSLTRVRNFLGMEDSLTELSLSSSHSPASSETQSLLSSELFDHGGRYSPRLRAAHSGYESFPDSDVVDSKRANNDLVLQFVTFLCYGLALFVTVAGYAIILSDNVDLLVAGIKAVIIVGFLFSMVTTSLSTYVFYLREHTGWGGEVLVHAALLTIICADVGGIALLLAN